MDVIKLQAKLLIVNGVVAIGSAVRICRTLFQIENLKPKWTQQKHNEHPQMNHVIEI